jgi:hypothetical protein
MQRYKVRQQAKKKIYVHNDLSNTAHHLKNRIEAMEAAGNREGIALDIMSCIVMFAFTFEAKVNFLGAKVVADWKEKSPFHIKVREISEAIQYNLDDSVRPFKTMVEIEIDETVELDESELDESLDLSLEWNQMLTVEFVKNCSEDINTIWKIWLSLAKIELFETLTSGERSVTLIQKYADVET